MVKARSGLRKSVERVSNGVLSKMVDLVLVSVYFSLEASLGGYTRIGFADEKAIEDLGEVNFESIKNSLRYLKNKGLVQSVKEKILLPKITEEGRKRIMSILPSYDVKRVWDGRVYLVIYDIPRQRNLQRDLLRNYLKKIKCASLQYSVWLTPYNPKTLIEEFVDRHSLDKDLILISSMGRDGTIGEMDIKDLMEDVYNIPELNLRYEKFITDLESKVLSTKDQVVFGFLSILKDDPQIPFELLPDYWVGDKAFYLYRDFVS